MPAEQVLPLQNIGFAFTRDGGEEKERKYKFDHRKAPPTSAPDPSVAVRKAMALVGKDRSYEQAWRLANKSSPLHRSAQVSPSTDVDLLSPSPVWNDQTRQLDWPCLPPQNLDESSSVSTPVDILFTGGTTTDLPVSTASSLADVRAGTPVDILFTGGTTTDLPAPTASPLADVSTGITTQIVWESEMHEVVTPHWCTFDQSISNFYRKSDIKGVIARAGPEDVITMTLLQAIMLQFMMEQYAKRELWVWLPSDMKGNGPGLYLVSYDPLSRKLKIGMSFRCRGRLKRQADNERPFKFAAQLMSLEACRAMVSDEIISKIKALELPANA
jgi:hypothetical protein